MVYELSSLSWVPEPRSGYGSNDLNHSNQCVIIRCDIKLVIVATACNPNRDDCISHFLPVLRCYRLTCHQINQFCSFLFLLWFLLSGELLLETWPNFKDSPTHSPICNIFSLLYTLIEFSKGVIKTKKCLKKKRTSFMICTAMN